MLNDAQQRAVTTTGNCLITACPGSGKTTVLVHRAARLLGNPDRMVLGVTFTAEAARDLDRRIRAALPDAGKRVLCGTFHSLCKRQLEKTRHRIKLVSEQQQADLVRRAIADAGPPGPALPYDVALAYIDSAKTAVDELEPDDENPCYPIFLRYQDLLRQLGANDFADLIQLTVRGLRDGTVAPFPHQHILIDEFQDTDQIQLQWAKEHLHKGAEVTVVGDDDQSIFSWRGSLNYTGLESFRVAAAAAHIALDTTYRCPQEIMVPASRLITCNRERISKSLHTANRERGLVKVRGFASRDDEFGAVVQAIQESGRPGEWAVLARTNGLLEGLESHCAGQVPMMRPGGRSFWDLRGPSLFLGLCHSVAFDDMIGVDLALRRSGVGEEAIKALHASVQSDRPGGVERFLRGRSLQNSKDPIIRLRFYLRQWRAMRSHAAELRGMLTAISIYIQRHVKLYSKERTKEERDVDVARLGSCVSSIGRLPGPLAGRLTTLQHARDTAADPAPEAGKGKGQDKGSKKPPPPAARLLTLHSAKGQEFPNVWMLGCDAGVLPSVQSADLPEERRLCYVGMTRAKQRLIMSYLVSEKNPPSQFLFEAGLL